MTDPPRVLIAGAYGVFGRLLAKELLATTTARVVLAGRDPRRLAAACRALEAGDRAETLVLDLRDTAALTHAAEGCFAVACTAGPFQALSLALLRVAVAAGAHWVDIGDYTGWVLPLLADGEPHAAAASAGVSVIPALSTVPTTSGVLVRWCRERLPEAVRARLTLYIGNRNAKGAGAIASALGGGLTDPVPVELPAGRRSAYRCASPDTALLREELGIEAEFRVSFEMRAAGRIMAAAAALTRRMRPEALARLARTLSRLSAPLGRFGTDIGCLQAELWDDAGRRATASVSGFGQRLAILPCALALEALLTGELQQPGVVHPVTWLAPDEWIARLQARGIRFQGRPP